jgi:hypothetical protein
MRSTFSKRETVLLIACLALLALAWLAPAQTQPADYHAFADRGAWGGVPYAMDVLSNLPFALAGLAGGYCLWKSPPRTASNMQRAMAALFFGGLLLTAAGSSWYHWQPDDAGLTIDRCAMAVAFAGLLGVAAAGRISERAGAALGLAVLLLAPLGIRTWAATGNVLPWAALQSGGLLLLLWMAWLPARYRALEIRWSLVILAYAAAKLLEVNDHEIYRMTGELVSGHTLKHVVAAVAAWPVVAAVWALHRKGQNVAGGARLGKLAARRAGRA